MNKVIEDYIKGKKPRKSKDPGLSVPIRRMVRNSFRFGAGVTGALSATAIKSAIFGDLDFVADEVLTHRMYLRHFARNSLATARSFCSGGAGIVGGIGAFGITSLVAANVYWTNSDPRNSYRGLDEVMIGPGEPVLNRRRFSTISCHNMRLR